MVAVAVEPVLQQQFPPCFLYLPLPAWAKKKALVRQANILADAHGIDL